MSCRLISGRLLRRLALAAGGLGFGILVSAVNHGFGPAADQVSEVTGNGGVWLAVGLGACLVGS